MSYEKTVREQALKSQDEATLAVVALADFAKLTEEERAAKVVEYDKRIRAMEFSMKTERKAHREELVLQAQGRKVDAITALTMERVRRRCDQLEAAMRAAGTAPPAEKLCETPGTTLMGFQAKPTRLSARDLVLAIEDEMGAPCPAALRVLVEEALSPSS